MNNDEYTLAIDDVIDIKAKFTLRSKGVDKVFAPTLTINRIDPSDAELNNEKSIKEFMLDNTTAWKDQRLVLDRDGNPADFTRPALEKFFQAPGVCILFWNTYVKEIAAKEKN